jgi:O-6-methylguanine DNA methyltransferase
MSAWQLRRQFPGLREVLPDRLGAFHPDLVPSWFSPLARCLQDYYTDALRDGNAPQTLDQWSYWRPCLDWSVVTPFQRKVLEVTATIPCGMHMTYGQVAAKLGKPRATRAVGAALGANPWPVIIPCHRVTGRRGAMTGFSAPGGISTKKRMLALEGAPDLFGGRDGDRRGGDCEQADRTL